ncbi:cation diffusion facilitator family transporter [Edaphobacillus lindanitolerans]|uniref:Cation diffusion facilitator family transporter n=1 Tax=Edaphobacillus lindanitolerans TaxID=550447 RepID=A0A1U7PN95_9BACI|nr:cation diffusion facilitator family transporter [Edaphobacillus lindanitolerans]SIT92154.1 cation diffusion facilitator family transporter [Edaphobacillus lindanitolerans]
MNELWKLLKNGNKPSLLAGIVNAIVALLKGAGFLFTGNVALFAETMHSLGDAANQFFVYVGSALSKKAPTARFPNGFGRIVNLVCLFAVVIVGIMAYETLIEGWHHLVNPSESAGFWISFSILAAATLLEAGVLYKAGKEILHDAGVEGGGLAPITKGFANLKYARPATKLVFMEDTVATAGGLLALIAVVLANFFGLGWTEGLASMIIGGMMFFVVGVVFLENARGAIGETDEEMLQHIAYLVAEDPDVRDLQKVEVIKEGEALHVEIVAEVESTLSFAEVDDIRDRLLDIVASQKNIADVVISFDEDDGIRTYKREGKGKSGKPSPDVLKKLQ